MDKRLINDRIEGLLLGTAVGDSIGLPREGLSRKRAKHLFGAAPLRHRFFFDKGMISDDTEHACMVVQALLASRGDADRFVRSLGWRLRFWLLGIPAGVGLATLKGILKLWLGFGPGKSGIHSAGNGPAMRSGLIGLYTDDIVLLKKLVKASTYLTHTEQRAYEGALAIALACQYAASKTSENISIDELFAIFEEHITTNEMKAALLQAQVALENNDTAGQFANSLGLSKGIPGYIVHTVPVAVFCWLNHKDNFRAVVEEVILLGGDTDTTGAITGALSGALLGSSAIPLEWLNGIMEWPRSTSWIKALSERFAGHISGTDSNQSKSLGLFWPSIIIRNIFFTLVVLMHGLRRIAPPY